MPPWPNRIQAVLFDAGDTLIGAYPSEVDRWIHFCQVLGLAVDDSVLQKLREGVAKALRFRVRSDTGIDSTFWLEYNEIVLRSMGVPDSRKRARTVLDYCRVVRPPKKVLPDVRTCLDQLSQVGVKMAIISNWPDLKEWLGDFGIDQYFSALLVARTPREAKPAPVLFETAVRALAVRPQSVVYVGDTCSTDVFGSANAGICPVLIDRAGYCQNEKVVKIESLRELPALVQATIK
ncbi:MAG: HAD family hydrolase [Thermoleophilia bacterium]